LFDRVRMLEEEEVLAHLVEHVVLAPDVREPRLDVVGEERLDTTARREPDDQAELEPDPECEEDHDLEERRRLIDDPGQEVIRSPEDRRVEDASKDQQRNDDRENDLERARDSVPRVGVELAGLLVPTSEDVFAPEPVVAGAAFAEQEVDLAEHFETEE